MTLALRPYQTEGRDFLAGRRVALLADEMRVGKTPQAILAAHKLGAQSVLVVCPAIAVPHWEAEFRKWWPGEILPRLWVLSYDKARELWRSEGFKKPVDVFVPDECHFAKNPEAARTRMVYGKSGFAQMAGATWALSGTPAPKHAGELWCMLKAFGVVGMTYDEFVRRYCTINGFTLQVTGTKQEMIPELKELLAKIMLRRTRKQVAPDMPDIGFEFLEIKPTTNADLAAPLDMSIDSYVDWSDATGGNIDDRIAVARAKVEPLADQIAFHIDNGLLLQTVAFGWHTEPLMALRDALTERGVSAESITGATSSNSRILAQAKFKAGVTQVIVGNIMACGTAIDLSTTSHGFFLELDWVGANNLQAANRLVSMDKNEPVTFDICTTPGTTDDRVQRVLVRRMKELKALGLA